MGALHQNGVAEACIKVSTLGARTLLLHAQCLWPEAITTMLWLFALLDLIKLRIIIILIQSLSGKPAYVVTVGCRNGESTTGKLMPQ